MNRPPSSPQLSLYDLLPVLDSEWSRLVEEAKVHLTYSCRGAIYQYLSWLQGTGLPPGRRNVVLVPSFHCPNVVDPVLHAGFEIRFYMVTESLEIDSADFQAKLGSDVAAAVFINFFGFPGMPENLVRASREAGAKIIEDCSHSFLASSPLRLVRGDSDATVYSFWKTLPGRNGGGLIFNEADASHVNLRLSPQGLANQFVRGRALLGQVLDSGRTWFGDRFPRGASISSTPEEPRPAVRRPAAEAYPYDADASNWRMPWLSQWVFRNSNLRAVVEARRANYSVLERNLISTDQIWPLFKTLPADVCPWGFPIVLLKRSQRDFLIRARGVPVFTFGEVLHPRLFEQHSGETRMLQAADFLSDNVLVLATHQGLTVDQMREIANIVNEFIALA